MAFPTLGVPRRRTEFWVVLPAVVMIFADAIVTLALQPAAYWAESFLNRTEDSPLGSALLAGHPAWFAVFVVLWAAFVVLLVGRLRDPWKHMLALTIVVGHTAGLYSWLGHRIYFLTLPLFLFVGIMTIACWQQAQPGSLR